MGDLGGSTVMTLKPFRGAAMAVALAASAGSATAADTLSAGVGAPFTNVQPSLALIEDFTLEGYFPPRSGDALTDDADDYVMGMVRNFAFPYDPDAVTASGGRRQIMQAAAMFAIIGAAYGGDGRQDFAVPNLGGATIIGAAAGGGQGATSGYRVGQALGSATTTLSVSALPAHDHTLPGGAVTGMTGGQAAIDQRQPSLTMTYLIAAGAVHRGQRSAVPVGQVIAFAGAYAPYGWRPADGALLTIAAYPDLYGRIGATYGGDGVKTFALPDLRGRTIVGAGTGVGLAPVALGQAFGSDSTILTLSQLAPHGHRLPGRGVTGPAGGGAPIDNAQPSLGLNYLVAMSGAVPRQDNDIDGDAPMLGEIIAFAGDQPPSGYALADGRLLPISQNPALFALFGAAYGGDGVTTFALPDLRGRAVIGTGNGLTVGTGIGAETVRLTAANLPPHTHSLGAGPEPSR